ncbi:armadillo-type protein [Mycotypha africana]|uniref:armadillo-type protein n=1 Tax=Mycotypha africana TaxID=64632 RepID=UPI0023011838|nr:armadillo-type protein [Mycotypha africana]KAI8988374.1 armadillo-type protein [Mycotypha africana]
MAEPQENTAELGWPEFIKTRVVNSITDSSVTNRLEFLNHSLLIRLRRKDLPVEALPSLLHLILLTIPRYSDRASRAAICEVLKVLNDWNAEVFQKTIIPVVGREAEKYGKRKSTGECNSSAAERFVLLTWVNVLFTCALKRVTTTSESAKITDPLFSIILNAQSILIDSLADDSKRSISKSALADVRRTIRHNASFIPQIIDVALANAQTCTPSYKNAVLIGTVIDVSFRLKTRSDGREMVEKEETRLTEYYLKNIISSRTPVHRAALDAFHDFIKNIITKEKFESEYIPVLDKMMLRSPEIVLHALSRSTLAFSFDPSSIFATKWLDPLLNHLRSTSPTTVSGAKALWNSLSKVCHETESLFKVVEGVSKLLTSGKVSSWEHRVALYNALSSLARVHDPALSQKVLETFFTMTAKEPHEQAMASAVDGIGRHLTVSIYNDDYCSANEEFVEKIVKVSTAGLESAKPLARKTWANAVGNTVWESQQGTSKALSSNIVKYLQAFFKTYNKIVEKPLIWKDGPVEAYIMIAIISGRIQHWPHVPQTVVDLLKTEKYPSDLLVTEPKPSYLLWDRIYTKATSAEEGMWFVRALTSVFLNETQESLEKTGAGYLAAQALIWIVTSHPEYTIRSAAHNEISSIAAKEPIKLSHFMKQGLQQWLLDLEKNTKDSTAVSTTQVDNYNKDIATYRLASLLNAITSYTDDLSEATRSAELVDLLVLAHHEYIASPGDKYNWITLVQRANVNPGKLVQEQSAKLLETLKSALQNPEKSQLFYNAVLSAISTLVFISPDLIPEFIELAEENLAPELMSGIGELESNIWKHSVSTPYVDVLQKDKKSESRGNKKGSKNDEEWEEELRAELAKKKGLTQKLTKEQQASVDAQLKKEAEIRTNVQSVYEKLTLGLAIVRSLIHGNKEEMPHYLNDIINMLLNIGKQKAGLLLDDQLVETYLHLGDCVDEEIQSICDAISLSILRSNNILPIPSRWLDEPLGALVTRVLYRLRFITENHPLSPASFGFVFPALYKVIEQGGIDCGKNNENAQEQITMAVDIIGFHCIHGESHLMPRTETIDILLRSIKDYPSNSKTARTSLVTLCESMGETVTIKEIENLFQGLLSSEVLVRTAALQALELLDLTDIDYSSELWVACHDENESNAALALELWEDNAMDVEDGFRDKLIEYIVSDNDYVRQAASKALAEATEQYPETVYDTLQTIYSLYKKLAAPLDPEYDEYGMVKPETLDRPDPWEARVGLSLTLKAIAPFMQLDNASGFCRFLIEDQALGDRNEQVRRRMLEAGLAVITAYGNVDVEEFLKTFELYLNSSNDNSDIQDFIRQAVVILYGGAAGYLSPGDEKVNAAVEKLIETLDTPSETVQSAVTDCLPPLIKKCKDEVPRLIKLLLNKLFKGEKYAQRRGAAYGLAGVVKGRGITALKECNVMNALKDAVDNKRAYEYRQGALFAFETLSATLGRLFEPYIIQIIPLLLICSSDANMDVREASSDAARVIMSKISGHCVKLILPSILEGLEERQWRTKKASVELLGSMAYCAPKQLSISLPNIIPRISEVLADTHSQVQAAAKRSLQLFGEVISNPEIQELVPVLLKALSDPNNKTAPALTALLQTSFVHYIDPPSLALVMPILERGLRERATDVKTRSAQIVGNMASLTDQKDLVPYLNVILPGLHEVLIDPVPAARGTAAKALGALVEKLGEENFPGLVLDLLDTLKSETGGVDRQGAAQGLSEVLAGLGLERLDGLLPEIISNADSPRPYVREGFISLLIYLPATFGTRFQPYLGRIIPPILNGLADESEYVRDASLRAGRMIVNNYAVKAVDLLLPELEKGIFDNKWRIRQSSVQLVGELLFRITGITHKNTDMALGNVDELLDDDADAVREDSGSDNKKKQLVEVLGKERRDRILAALYIVRQDNSGVVRQASLQVWKGLVANTPRTLKDILHVLISMIIKLLASDNFEQRAVAGRTLSDIVQKLGESILPEILPVLEEGMSSDDEDIRIGVTVAYSEVMTAAEKVQVMDFANDIIPVIRKALCDPSDEVRETAAQAFDTLHQNVGAKAIDEILPSLLNSLQSSDETSTYALSALKEIMSVRSNVVFPVLIPTLITVPITEFNARALASLVTVAGPALNKRLTTILEALVESLMLEENEETKEALKSTTEALLLSIDDEDGLHTLTLELMDYARDDKPAKRGVAADIVAQFFSESELDASAYIPDWIHLLILLLDDPSEGVIQSAWNALTAVTKSMSKEEYEPLVVPTRNAINAVGVGGIDIPGFCLPKGISCVLPIFLQGLMYGSTENREQSALAIGDLVDRTSASALKPFVTQITGPLIRILGDRYPAEVKAAILQTLSLMLNKVPMHLKLFLPQLQRTFVKSYSDSTSDVVRERAAAALKVLSTLQPRVDPTVAEILEKENL